MIESIFEYPFLTRIFNKILDDKTKLNLISCSKYLFQFRNKWKFNDFYYCCPEDMNEWFYDSLTNVRVGEIFEFPVCLNSLAFSHIIFELDEKSIPNHITHLIFGNRYHFAKSLRYKDTTDPSNYKKPKYVQNVQKDFVPSSVTHLTFGYAYQQLESQHIPKSVISLKFKNDNHGDLLYDFPNNIEILELNLRYKKRVNNLPNSLKKLTCCNKFYERNKDLIPKNTKIILF